MHGGGGYEYGFVTTALGPKAGTGRRRGLSPEEVETELAEFSGALADSLHALDGGGWEALSHQMVPHGDGYLVTVMIRRLTLASTAMVS
jgi:hypothetical protein